MRAKAQIAILSLSFCLLITQCSTNSLVMETVLNGFDQGKKTIKLESRLYKAKLDNGRKGYRLETLVHFALGTKVLRKTTRTAYLNDDYSLYKSSKVFQKDREFHKYTSIVKDGQITVESQIGNEPTQKKSIASKGPVFVDLHPLIYGNDLTSSPGERIYKMLDEENVKILSQKVKYMGESSIFEESKQLPIRHFKIQALTAPEEMDDFYLDPATKNIVKIQMGLIKFIPAT